MQKYKILTNVNSTIVLTPAALFCL